MVSDIMQHSSERFQLFGKICPARATAGQCVIRKDFIHLSERFCAWDFVFDIRLASVSFGKIFFTSRKDFVFDTSGPASVSFGKISTPSRKDFIFDTSGPASVSFGKILTTSRQDFVFVLSVLASVSLGKILIYSRKDFLLVLVIVLWEVCSKICAQTHQD